MKKVLTKIDKIVLLCRNIQKTSSVYSQTLGLRVYLQSSDLIELKDSNRFSLYLHQVKNPSQLSKGYSPILSFNVEHFDDVYNKLLRYQLIPDGEIVEAKEGKIATFLGLDGETISINNFRSQEQKIEEEESLQIENDQIKQLLNKIKM